MEPEIIATSASQSPEVVKKILADLGYEDVQVDQQTYQGTEPAAAGTPPVEGKPSDDPNAGGKPAAGEGEPPVEEPVKKKPGSQKEKERRIQLEAQLAEERADKARIVERLEKLERGTQAPPAAEAKVETAKPAEVVLEAPKKPVRPKRPRIEDADINGDFDLLAKKEEEFYEADEQFTIDLSNYTVDLRDFNAQKTLREKEQREADENATAQRKAAETQQQQHSDQWKAQQSRAVTRWPDWNQKVAVAVGTPMVAMAIQDFPNGSELAYWLAEHPEEATKLADLSRGICEQVDGKFTAKMVAGTTQAQYRLVLGDTYAELKRLAAALPAETTTPPAVEELDDDEEDETEDPAQAGTEAHAPPAEIPADKTGTGKPPAKKHEPHQPVGGRQAGSGVEIERLSAEELRALPPDKYRDYMEKQRKGGR